MSHQRTHRVLFLLPAASALFLPAESSSFELAAPRGPCETIASHTDADFDGGSFVLQGGFQQGEILAASYVLTAADFPVTLIRLQAIFMVSGATESTTTRWSALVWSGYPNNGTLVTTISSNGTTIPHINLGPGTNGYRVSLEPGNLAINNNGSNVFSVGIRVDQHNSPPADPCAGTPSTCCNAFPTTDVSGLHAPTNNWIYGTNCGPFGCPAGGGWAKFSELPGFCRPSGDWVMRAYYRSGPCCDTTPGDTNGDSLANSLDVNGFVRCLLTGAAPDGQCGCADFNADNAVSAADVGPFVTLLLAP